MEQKKAEVLKHAGVISNIVLEEEIKNLKHQLNSALVRIAKVESSSSEVEKSIKNMGNTFQTINSNINEIIHKLDAVNEDKEINRMFEKSAAGKSAVTKPIRGLAIGTLCTIISASVYVGKIIKIAGGTMKDIVEEAQNQNSQRKTKRG